MVVVDSGTTKAEVSRLREEIARLCAEYGFAHTAVEIEWGDDECRMAKPTPLTAFYRKTGEGSP